MRLRLAHLRIGDCACGRVHSSVSLKASSEPRSFMEVLKTAMSPIRSFYGLSLLDLVRKHEDVAGETISSLEDLLLLDPPCNLQCSTKDENYEHDCFKKADMVVLVAMIHDFMCRCGQCHIFVIRYNLEIGRIYWKMRVKGRTKLILRPWAGHHLRSSRFCCPTHEGMTNALNSWGVWG